MIRNLRDINMEGIAEKINDIDDFIRHASTYTYKGQQILCLRMKDNTVNKNHKWKNGEFLADY